VRVEALFLLGVGIFFGIVGIVYWFWGYEDAGGTMLLGCTLLGLVPGTYYWYWHRRMGARPEDRDDATIEDGAGVINSFPGSSIWPFFIGLGAFFSLLALVFGAWLLFIGVGLMISAAVGVTVESRRGGRV
jgi:hypothetical protein